VAEHHGFAVGGVGSIPILPIFEIKNYLLINTMRKKIDWLKLEKIYQLCGECSVSFSLNYEEGSDEFNIEISSSSQKENFISKSRSFDTVIEMGTDWLNSIKY